MMGYLGDGFSFSASEVVADSSRKLDAHSIDYIHTIQQCGWCTCIEIRMQPQVRWHIPREHHTVPSRDLLDACSPFWGFKPYPWCLSRSSSLHRQPACPWAEQHFLFRCGKRRSSSSPKVHDTWRGREKREREEMTAVLCTKHLLVLHTVRSSGPRLHATLL